MKILLTEKPSGNAYIESLMNAYKKAGHEVFGDASNFFNSNVRPDILHIHWPERLNEWYSAKKGSQQQWLELISSRLKWYQSQNVTIIHTLHNLAPHDSKEDSSREAFELIIAYSDILVHHCTRSVKIFNKLYSESQEKKNIVCPHGDYLIDYKFVNREEARRKLNLPIDKTIILNFGKQRPYKNHNFVVDAFNKLELQSKYLILAGEYLYPPVSFQRWLLRSRNMMREILPNRTVKYFYRSFSSDELAEIFCAADCIFLGQHSALNSGVLPLAATFRRPVIFPDVGCFSEAMQSWKSECFAAGDVQGAAESLKKICLSVQENNFELPDNGEWLAKNSWENHVGNILQSVSDL